MGLALVAVETEHTIMEAATQRVLSAGARWALLGGVALYMTAILFIAVAACRRRFLWQTVSAIALILELALLDQTPSPLTLEGFLFTVLVAKVSAQVLTTKPVEDEEQITVNFGDLNQ